MDNKKTTNITLNITTSFNFDIEVKNGKVSWEDVYDKLCDLHLQLPDNVNIMDWDNYYLGKEVLESELEEEGIELED